MESFDFNLYEELGLDASCTESDIRAAYKKKALIHHPDRNGGVQSEEFLRVKSAFDTLIDTDKRRNYDAFHDTGEFKRDGRPMTASEAAWLVDQQKRSWGVKEIHPFAVCILCDSCPCPADAVCDGCGMTYCQLCVRKMHCRGGMQPHYPLKSSTKFSENLKKQGIEKEREHKLLKGNTNQWLMHDEDFRMHRDVYRYRAKNEMPEMCWYWAWGQTRYTVHLAFWLASEDNDADVEFSVTEDGKQRISITPHDNPLLLERVFAYPVNTSRSGEAFTFSSMHCMTFVMLKAQPGQRWRRLFEGDSEGLRELPLGEPPHSVSEVQVDGFKPVQHYMVAGRKETASEWYEVTINVPIPEACERKHLDVVLEGSRLAVRVAGWMEWERKLHHRSISWEDNHHSQTHVDMQNSTWLMTRDEARDFKCVQFVLSEWQEGASKNQEFDVKRQLEGDKGKIILEDADPMHMYDLVEAEMYLRAGAVFKPRSKIRPKALELIEQMEKQMEAEAVPDENWRESPFADCWEEDEEFAEASRNESQMIVRDEDGGEVEEASEWWAACEREEKEEWNMEVEIQEEEHEMRRAAARELAKEQEARAAQIAAARAEEEEAERNRRRKEQALKNREIALKLRAQMGEEVAADPRPEDLRVRDKALQAQLGVSQAREAAAAAARANPLAPKRIVAEQVPKEVGSSALPAAAAAAEAAAEAGATAGAAADVTDATAEMRTASLAKCGYYFEDSGGDTVKVTVPLAEACGAAELPKEGAVHATFSETNFKLDVTLGNVVHKLDVGELHYRIDAKASVAKTRVKTKKVIVELKKLDTTKTWRKLTAL